MRLIEGAFLLTDVFVLDNVFKFTSENLADRGLGQRIHKNDLTRNLVACELRAAVFHNVILGDGRILQYNHGFNRFAGAFVRNAHNAAKGSSKVRYTRPNI